MPSCIKFSFKPDIDSFVITEVKKDKVMVVFFFKYNDLNEVTCYTFRSGRLSLNFLGSLCDKPYSAIPMAPSVRFKEYSTTSLLCFLHVEVQ